MVVIALGIAAGVLFLLLIASLLAGKESKNRMLQAEAQREEARINFTKTIQEKDSEIQGLMQEKDALASNFEIQKNDLESRMSQTVAVDDTVNKALIEEKQKALDESNKALEDYKKLTIELVKDMHELEDKYINLGGNLDDLYSDYNEYYGD